VDDLGDPGARIEQDQLVLVVQEELLVEDEDEADDVEEDVVAGQSLS
jgi:hypothetical protein